jgi:malonate-semialdehyde dehydrogenase (acetylating)/methylmalonate-semialdehyde dehydrogenase
MTYTVPHWINGQPYENSNENNHIIHNPALGSAIGKVHLAQNHTCDKAIESAKAAFPAWSATPPVKRATILFRFRQLLLDNQKELAHLVTKEHGKTIEDALGSVARAIEVVELHCGLVNNLKGDMTSEVARQIDCQTIRQPLGICMGVSPFNFPVMVPAWMVVPAIAFGNCFILKPSEQDPSAALRFIQLLHEAGLPAGVAQCVQGDKTTVDYLVSHPDIVACTAVASTAVARSIYSKATELGKRAHTFGGAKNHAVLMPDADMKQAATAINGAAFGSAGERCMALSVVVCVGHHTKENLLEHLLPKIKAIRVDRGDAEKADMGPLVSAQHRQKVVAMVNQGVEEGAELLIDGRAFTHPDHPQGYYLGPCLFDKVTASMSIYREEIFGPVLALITVNDFEEALTLVNRHQYGNGTAIFTRDGYTARHYSHHVNAGMVGINIPIPVPMATHPFGGWKQSVFGDTDMHGNESMHFYTKRKSITIRWPEQTDLGNEFVMPTHE